MRARCLGVLLATIAVHHAAMADGASPRIEVFTLSTVPLTNVRGATVHFLDSVVLLEQQLSANLPSDPQQARTLAAQRMAALGPQLRLRAGAGAAGLARAAQLGVSQVPAVVFDGRSVVYGVTDVDVARRIFDMHARQPGTMR
jgi:integrating conjugative element protein (TIGR03757 family)